MQIIEEMPFWLVLNTISFDTLNQKYKVGMRCDIRIALHNRLSEKVLYCSYQYVPQERELLCGKLHMVIQRSAFPLLIYNFFTGVLGIGKDLSLIVRDNFENPTSAISTTIVIVGLPNSKVAMKDIKSVSLILTCNGEPHRFEVNS